MHAPVILAPADELVGAFQASRARPALRVLTEHLREPRAVTDQGMLDEPDVAALGASLDELLGEGGRDAVYVVAGWAAAAGFVSADDGLLARADAADALDADDERSLDAAAAAYHGIRRLVYSEPLGRWFSADPNPALFDGVLGALLDAGSAGLPVAALEAVAWRVLIAEVAVGAEARGRRREVRDDIRSETAWMAELLEDLGVVRRDDADTVTVTPLGIWLVRRQLAEQGIDVPLVGALAGAPLGQVLAVVTDYPPAAAEAELDAWVAAAPGVEAAAGALADHAAGTDEPAERTVALAALDRLGAEAEPAVRTLLDDEQCRPHALAWLARRGFEAGVAVADGPDALVERLAVAMVDGGASGAADALGQLGGAAAQIAAVEGLWRSGSPHAEAVLEAVGSGAGEKAVAKAARRTLFKLRTAR